MACSHGHTQHMHANTGTNTHTDTHTNARMHARIHTHTDTCMHTCTHTYTSHSRTIPPCKTSQCMSCRQDHMVTLLPTTLHLYVLYVYTSNPVHLGKLQTSTWMFRAIGPHQGSGASKTPTRPLNSITFTDTHSHWTIQPHITGLPSNPIPYTYTCSRIIRHIAPLPRRYIYTIAHAHTSTHSEHYTTTVFQTPTQYDVAQMHMYSHMCTRHPSLENTVTLLHLLRLKSNLNLIGWDFKSNLSSNFHL